MLKIALECIIHKLGEDVWNMGTNNLLEVDEHLLLKAFSRKLRKANNT
jgi:hypothetical protein